MGAKIRDGWAVLWENNVYRYKLGDGKFIYVERRRMRDYGGRGRGTGREYWYWVAEVKKDGAFPPDYIASDRKREKLFDAVEAWLAARSA